MATGCRTPAAAAQQERAACPADGTDTRSPAEPAEVRLRVEQHLAGLAERMDPDSFSLFLRIMSGLGRAFSRHNRHVDIELTPEERALYTPEFQKELVRLLEKADFPASRVVTDDTDSPDDGRAGRDEAGVRVR